MSFHPKNVGKLKLYVRKTSEDTLAFFSREITHKLKEFRDVEKRDVLFLTSGGSALSVLDLIDESVIGPYLTIGIFDERYDPTNRTSNYAQLMKTRFYQRAVQRGCRLIDTTTGADQTKEQLADYYEHELHDWKTHHPKGVIIATMGVAADGHTAGIIPYPEDPKFFHKHFEGDRWIVSYDASGKNRIPYRVTTTFTFLHRVDTVFVYMVGKEKGKMFRKLLEGDDLAELPGRIIKTLAHGGVYVDEALMSASGISDHKKPHSS